MKEHSKNTGKPNFKPSMHALTQEGQQRLTFAHKLFAPLAIGGPASFSQSSSPLPPVSLLTHGLETIITTALLRIPPLLDLGLLPSHPNDKP